MSDTSTPSNNASFPPAGLLEGILSNPESLQRIAGILGAMTSPTVGKPEAEPDGAVPTADSSTTVEIQDPSAPTPPMPPLGDGLTALLSNPALLQQLPKLLSLMKPLMGAMQKPAETAPLPDTLSKFSPECRDNLLLALKPFLSPERRQAVDSILRISRLGSVLKQLK